MNGEVPADWLVVQSADEARADDDRLGIATGEPIYLSPGSFYIYWYDPERAPLRGVYNIPPEMVDEVKARVEANRSASYEELVGDIPGAGFADQKERIQIVKPPDEATDSPAT